MRQAAQMLQLSVRTVQEHAPALGASKVRRRWRIPYETVRRAQREGLPEAQEVHEVTVVSGSQSQTASDAMECIGVDEPLTTPSQTGQAVRTAAGGRQTQLLIKQDVVSPGYSEAQADLMMQLCLVIGDLMHKRLGLDATADTKPWQIWWTTDPVMANQVGGEALKDQPEEPDDGMGVLMALVRVGGGTDVEQSLAVAGYGWRPTERTIVVYGPYEPDVRDWQTLTLLMAYRETADKLQVGEAANMWLELGQQALPRPAAKRERWVS